MMDTLSAMLEAVRIRGSVYFWASFAPPWGVRVPEFEHVVRYHVVLRGHCWVRVDGSDEPICLQAGDLVAVPHGRPHTLSDKPKGPYTTLDRLLQQNPLTGDGALLVGDQDAGLQTRLVCGHFAHEADDDEHPLFRWLPPFIVVRGVASSETRWLDDMLRFISREVAASGPGTTAIVARLSEILFVQTLRSHVAAQPDQAVGWAGFLDPNLGRALARIHEDPGRRWSLPALAKLAGLSRTAFSVRFLRMMGMTPFDYLTRWRMTCAKQQLRTSTRSVADTALELGYQSEAAFHRAFTRHYGVGPGAFRRSLAG
jgi:AraC family transcriptional regulator, activator of mtrCDE